IALAIRRLVSRRSRSGTTRLIEMAETGDECFADAVREKFLALIARQIVEWQHCYGGPLDWFAASNRGGACVRLVTCQAPMPPSATTADSSTSQRNDFVGK